MDRRGRVKVADFGLAKIIGGEGGETWGKRGVTSGPSIVTETGKVMGTPQYMSPEQINAPGEVDHRADIYALGVVFYQMLTDELPGNKIEPPSKKVQIDVRLDEVVLRALEKKPELRYQQASILKTQVETIATPPTADANAFTENKTCVSPLLERLDKQQIAYLFTGLFGFLGFFGLLGMSPGQEAWYSFFILFVMFLYWIPAVRALRASKNDDKRKCVEMIRRHRDFMTQDQINQNEWSNPKNWSAMIYRSQLASRFFVPQRVGVGVTVNMGHQKYGKGVFIALQVIIVLGLLGSAIAFFVLLKYGLKK